MSTVRMVRDAKKFADSHEALVEADDVDAWKAEGWKVEEAKAEPVQAGEAGDA